jgi:uncharacterized membrane protein
MEKTFAKVEDLATNLKEYADSRMEAVKLQVAEKSSAIMANVIAAIVVALVFFFLFHFRKRGFGCGFGRMDWTNVAWVFDSCFFIFFRWDIGLESKGKIYSVSNDEFFYITIIQK